MLTLPLPSSVRGRRLEGEGGSAREVPVQVAFDWIHEQDLSSQHRRSVSPFHVLSNALRRSLAGRGRCVWTSSTRPGPRSTTSPTSSSRSCPSCSPTPTPSIPSTVTQPPCICTSPRSTSAKCKVRGGRAPRPFLTSVSCRLRQKVRHGGGVARARG